jgi:hypothetical protein
LILFVLPKALLLENSSLGLEGIEGATNKDTGEMIKAIEKNFKLK